MRVKLVGVVATVAAVGLAVFAATGFGGEGTDPRSLDSGFSTPRFDVDDIRRVEAPSGEVSASALAEASKRKKAKITYFELAEPLPLAGNAPTGGEFPCPKGKVVNGYFLTGNEFTMLGLSAPQVDAKAWLFGVRNFDAAATQVSFGVACATGMSVK